MARLTLDEVKQSKNFYRNNFHRVMKALLISICVILFLLMVLAYVVLNRPTPNYYSTNSVGFIDLLTPLSKPNMSSEALLPPDPPSDATTLKNMNFDTGQEQPSVEQQNPQQQQFINQ